ncbi:MAG: succinate dehydrogenase, hydrophobic membrane anchor protein [Pseudomonadota bacterium]
MVSTVTTVTSLTRSGVADFFVQRVTAVVLALYTVWVLGFFLVTPELSHEAMVGHFGTFAMKLFSTLAVLSVAAHAWIGMWTVGTDYIRPHYFGARATSWRIAYQLVCMAVVFIYVAWGLTMFWSL